MINSKGQKFSVIKNLNGGANYFKVIKYTTDCDLDLSFGNNGHVKFSNSDSTKTYALVLGDNDSFFFAYSIEDPTNSVDVLIHHLDNNGKTLNYYEVPFDKTEKDKNTIEEILELQYISEFDRLLLVAATDNSSKNDMDFGVSMLDIDMSTGKLAILC